MTRIKKTGESIKRKLDQNNSIELQDVIIDPKEKRKPEFVYTKKELEASGVKSLTAIHNDSKTVRQQVVKKKVTFYIALATEGKLNEVYARKMMKNEKEDKSSLISRAIDLLWKEEKNYEF